MKRKFVVCMIVENEQEILPITIESFAPHVDEIILVVGDKDLPEPKYTYDLMKKYEDIVYINRLICPYDHDSLGGNGKQRNVYLKYLQEHHEGDWCLVLDADEMVDDTFKDYVARLKTEEKKSVNDPKDIIFSPKMRHFIGSFGYEDATQGEHYCLGRLFIVHKDLYYNEVEHPLLNLKGKENQIKSNLIKNFTIWHLGYVRDMLQIHKKYKNHLIKSNVHSKEFLHNWWAHHSLGYYPKKQIPIQELPNIIKKTFDLDIVEDVIYFNNRNLETKHFLDAFVWRDYFQPKKILVIGDGLGHHTFCLHNLKLDVEGFDISEWAVNTSRSRYGFQENQYIQEDVIKFNKSRRSKYDLIICYDILEHLEHRELESALRNIWRYLEPSKGKVLFSLPFKGESQNLFNDPTHKIFMTREEWTKELNKYFEVEATPLFFPYVSQILIGKTK